jgi:hypothetical protein
MTALLPIRTDATFWVKGYISVTTQFTPFFVPPRNIFFNKFSINNFLGRRIFTAPPKCPPGLPGGQQSNVTFYPLCCICLILRVSAIY